MSKAWKVTAVALQVGVYICLGAWVVLLGTLCSSPSASDAVGGHAIAYNCHGSIVYITRIHDILLKGLIPAMVILGVGAVAARRRAKQAVDGGGEPGQ